jgi:AraC-like DNA-binding protein
MNEIGRTKGDASVEPGMAGSIVVGTIGFALASGVEMSEILEATGLEPSALADPDARFPNDVVAQVWLRILAQRPGEAMPLAMARAAPFATFGVLSHGAKYAPDLRTVLSEFVRFRGLLSSELAARVLREDAHTHMRLQHTSDELDRGAGAVVGIALAVRFLREVVGVDGLAGVAIAHAPIGPPEEYEEFFKAPVRFDAPHTELQFRSELVDAPLPRRDETAHDFITQHLDSARARVTQRGGLAQVHEALEEQARQGEYSAQALAKSLGVSLRALQRQVAEHGTTLSDLIDDLRRANAEELLGDARLSVEEVAYLLGYSDESAFRRAFKRLSGQSPASFRRQLL